MTELKLVCTCSDSRHGDQDFFSAHSALHDVIISSIYNAQGRASPQSLTDRVGTVISVMDPRLCLQIQASRCSCLQGGWGGGLHKRHEWEKKCIDGQSNMEELLLLLLHYVRLPDCGNTSTHNRMDSFLNRGKKKLQTH